MYLLYFSKLFRCRHVVAATSVMTRCEFGWRGSCQQQAGNMGTAIEIMITALPLRKPKIGMRGGTVHENTLRQRAANKGKIGSKIGEPPCELIFTFFYILADKIGWGYLHWTDLGVTKLMEVVSCKICLTKIHFCKKMACLRPDLGVTTLMEVFIFNIDLTKIHFCNF